MSQLGPTNRKLLEIFPAHPLPRHLSHSQVKSLKECGERYRLERVFRVPTTPAAWFPAGSAFHTATEVWDWSTISSSTATAGQTVDTFGGSEVSSSYKNEAAPDRFQTDPLDGGSGSRVDTKPTNSSDTKLDAKPGSVLDKFANATFDTDNDLTELWNFCLQAEVRKIREQVPAEWQDPSTWRASGRANSKETLLWWEERGPEMLRQYVDWRNTSGWTIAMMDDTTPAIEFNASTTLTAPDGEQVDVVGYIDRVYITDWGLPVVGDIKTGREPSDVSQLGEYSIFLAKLGFPQPAYGAYYLAKKGSIGSLRELGHFTEDMVAWEWQQAKRQRNNGEFLANPSSPFCGGCEMRRHCRFVGGDLAYQIPAPWEPGGKPPVVIEQENQ